MKILFISPGLLYYKKRPFEQFKQLGVESEIYGISKEMAKLGHKVYITGRFKNFNDEEMKIIDGIRFININTPHLHDEIIYELGSMLLYSKATAKKIKKINPDVINLNDRFSGYFPSKLDILKIFVTHNPDAMAFYSDFAIENNRLNYIFFHVKKRIEEGVMSRSNAIITLTKSIRDYLHENGFTNTLIIPNAVDETKYTDKSDENYILFAGRLTKVKGIPYLIQAFSEICNQYDTNLLIVGSGTDEKMLKRMVSSRDIENRVIFVPIVSKSELSEYLSRCSVFVLPSLFECMPVALLEAMASGKTVIASDIPGPQDIITHEYDGFLFEKGNVDELKKYIRLCLQNKNLCKRIGVNAKATVEYNYTFDKIAKKYLDLFKKLCGGCHE